MKGISPFVASALLIAVAFVIAGIYEAWLISFSKGTTKEIGKHAEKKLICNNGGIALQNLVYNSSKGNLTGEIINTNLIPLGDINLEIFYSNATREEKNLNMTLEPGEKNVFNIHINQNYEKIRVITNCSNVYDELSKNYISSV